MEYVINHIPIQKGKRPGTKTKMTSITVHNTGNPKSTAMNERNWLVNPENKTAASFHIAIDEKQAVECIPLDEIAYHSGKTEGNTTSIGIEICESGNYKQTEQNAVELIAKMLVERNWGIDRVRTHKSWSGKECPRLILSHWNDFLDRIRKEMDKLMQKKEETEISSWAKEAAVWVKEKGISDGTRPKDYVTREELWTMLYRMRGILGL